MIACTRVRELMLEAAPSELRGEGEGPVAKHLRACGACRRRAELLVRADRTLDAALGSIPELDVDAVLARVADAPVGTTLAGVAGTPAAGGSRARAASWGRALASRRRAWIPVAAAAAVAGALLLTRSPSPPTRPAAVPSEMPPLVETSPAPGVAILQTDNPDITVVWFFEQET